MTAARCLVVALALVLPSLASAKPVDIEIRGIGETLKENIRLFLSVADLKDQQVVSGVTATSAQPDDDDDEPTVSEFRLKRLHERAGEEIRQALAPFGYYRPTIRATLEETDEEWLARYEIEAGPRTVFGDVDIDVVGEGAGHPPIADALETIDIESGEPLLHAEFEAAKSLLFDTAYGEGFLAAEWQESEVRVGPDRERADVDLVLDTGPRFYFGEVTFEQNVLDRSLLQRYVAFEPGEPYDTQKLQELQLVLNDTQYFEQVEVTPQREQAGEDMRIPISVRTIPEAPQRYTIGVGYATDTGPRFSVGAILRRINRYGHRFRADLRLSAIENSVAARYEIPIENVAKDTLAFTASATQETIGDIEVDQFLLGVARSDGWRGFRRLLFLNLERENFEFGGGPSRQTDMLIPGIKLSRQRTDDLQYPRQGYNLTMDLRGASDSVLSDTSLLRFDVNARWVRALGEKTRVLLHAGAGALETNAFGILPPSQRFFTGGDRSVRGYGYQEIGARNAEGAVIGGEYRLIASVEFDWLFYRDYGAAVFVDSGDAFRDSPDFKTGAGLGFRWRSPVGMIRLDVAHPFDDPNDDYRIHLSIGPDLL